MVQLRMTTRDGLGPDGTPAVGRGYEVLDDDGEALSRDRLHPDAAEDIAVVEVAPTSVEQRRALSAPAFGVDRPVVLRPDADTVTVLDEFGRLEAGRVIDAVAASTRRLVAADVAAGAPSAKTARGDAPPEKVAWVSWEWLSEHGRTAIEVAISHPSVAPQPLEPPSRAAPEPGTGRAGGRGVWLGVTAVVFVIVVAFLSCS